MRPRPFERPTRVARLPLLERPADHALRCCFHAATEWVPRSLDRLRHRGARAGVRPGTGRGAGPLASHALRPPSVPSPRCPGYPAGALRIRLFPPTRVGILAVEAWAVWDALQARYPGRQPSRCDYAGRVPSSPVPLAGSPGSDARPGWQGAATYGWWVCRLTMIKTISATSAARLARARAIRSASTATPRIRGVSEARTRHAG